MMAGGTDVLASRLAETLGVGYTIERELRHAETRRNCSARGDAETRGNCSLCGDAKMRRGMK
jgi:hypothetical protein